MSLIYLSGFSRDIELVVYVPVYLYLSMMRLLGLAHIPMETTESHHLPATCKLKPGKTGTRTILSPRAWKAEEPGPSKGKVDGAARTEKMGALAAFASSVGWTMVTWTMVGTEDGWSFLLGLLIKTFPEEHLLGTLK